MSISCIPFSKRGFTLIELSIVLVIIGLVVGGVMAGQDLIQAARIRSQVAQVEQIDAAASTFRVKYNCIPGDCAKADELGLVPAASTAPVKAGNGDGAVGYGAANWTAPTNGIMYEYHYFWQNLYNANLMEGDKNCILGTITNNQVIQTRGSCFALSKLVGKAYVSGTNDNAANGMFRIQMYPAGHHYQLVSGAGQTTANFAVCGGANTSNVICNALQPADAYAIDAKMDDGMPMSGKVRAADASVHGIGWGATSAAASYNNPTGGAAGTSVCVSTDVSPSVYNITNLDQMRCALNIKTSW